MVRKNESRILEMYKSGHSGVEIASELGFTSQYIYHSLKTLGLSTKDRDRERKYGAMPQAHISRLRIVWAGMKRRCLDKKNKNYKNYGMRGILLCEEWLNFSNFLKWATSNNYEPNKQIDRINNNGNYYPDNCRWVTSAENCQNTRLTKLTKWMVVAARVAKTANIMTITEMSKFLNVERTVLGNAVNKRTWKNIYP